MRNKEIDNMIRRRHKIAILLFLILLTSSIIASSIVFRPYPTHMIVKQVFCISCHPDAIYELEKGTHINAMNDTQNRFLTDYVDIYGNVSEPIKTFLGPCYSCHITYQSYGLFGLTDPYVFNDSDGNLNSQYGYVIYWPTNNPTIPSLIFSSTNATITIEVELLSIEPADSTLDSTIKVIFSNYSGQQTGNPVCDCTQTLYEGDTHVAVISGIKHDYFSIILLLDGIWSNSLINLRVNGTDNGTESFFIIANSSPVIYEIPRDISDKYYFKTSGIYKAVRLDYVWSEWKNYALGSITSSEDIEVNTTSGRIIANTCLAPDAMCHINQKATYMGMNDDRSLDRSFYQHQMRFATSTECKLCHLNRMRL